MDPHLKAHNNPKDGILGAIITLFYNKRSLSVIITMSILLVSAVFTLKVQREAMPNVALGVFRVSLTMPGATAEQVEQDAIIPVENVIKDMTGIDSYTSTASAGGGNIMLSLDPDAPDQAAVRDETFRKMNLSSISGISKDVETMTVTEFNPGSIDVYILGLVRKDPASFSDDAFYEYAKALEDSLSTVAGVGSIEKNGYREKYVEINPNPSAMLRHHVDLNSIVNAIGGRNVRSSAGILQDPENRQSIVTISEYQNLDELRNTIIRAGFDGNRVLLRDVAKVAEVYPDVSEHIRVNQQDALYFAIKKQPAADIVKTTRNIKAFLEEQKKIMPDGLEFVELVDQGHGVNEVSRILITNGLIGFVLILLVLFIFLDFSTAFWTAMGLPITMGLTLAYMGATGLTVNYLTLTAMITMIGMLVDHGIVISETIFMRRNNGYTALRAAIEGLQSVFWPVVATVITTILAFLPLLMIGGFMGQFTRFFPIMVTVMLGFSFFEACFLLVSHLLHSKPPKQRLHHLADGTEVRENWFRPAVRAYQVMLKPFLRFRWFMNFLFFLILVGGAVMSIGVVKGFKMFDNSDVPILEINFNGFDGEPIELVGKKADVIEDIIWQISPPGTLKDTFLSVSMNNRGTSRGSINVFLKDKKDMSMSVQDYSNLLGARLRAYGRRSRQNLIRELNSEGSENTANRSGSNTGRGGDQEQVLRSEQDINKIRTPDLQRVAIGEEGHDYSLSREELSSIPVYFDNIRVGFAGGAGPGGRAISFRLYSDNAEALAEVAAQGEEILNNIPGTQNILNSNERKEEQIRVFLDYNMMGRLGISLAEVNSVLRTAFNGVTATKSKVGTDSTDYIVKLEKRYRESKNTILNLTVRAATGEFIPLRRFARLGTELSSPAISHFNGKRTLRLSGDVDLNDKTVTATKVNAEFKEKIAPVLAKYPGVILDTSGGEAEQTQSFINDAIPAFVIAVVLILLTLILLFDSVFQPIIVMAVIPFGLVGGLLALGAHDTPLGFMAVLGLTGLIGVVVNDSVVMVEFINHIVERYPNAPPKKLMPMVLKGAGRRLRAVTLTSLTTILGLMPTIYGLGGDPGVVRPIVIVLGYGLAFSTIISLFYIPCLYMMHLDVTHWRYEQRRKRLENRAQKYQQLLEQT